MQASDNADDHDVDIINNPAIIGVVNTLSADEITMLQPPLMIIQPQLSLLLSSKTILLQII